MQAAPCTIAFLYRPPARFGAATIADLRDVARPQRQVAGLFVAESAAAINSRPIFNSANY